ncbi:MULTISPECIES: beta-galactosidase [Caulobacter]|jgi:beta-galactosidase|uniref:Beta-galactosidase n=1 Tax=Caulobacter vibrioides OR37 TaxID=1292034 RepID=R0D2C3_CAUVI|nr:MULTISPECIES: beta-galactosidase [Caulobacter]ENZ82595.1 beta-galactosidase [Caulobacter vibrioides OR37]MBQ1563699.1 beta-galactosidase [Caulobacter sp.]
MLGVCYYPEQWPTSLWREDARRMKALGLTYVRIGEFAWSRFEPEPGVYDFAWFDEIIQILGEAGLKVVIGTPTATPPKWLIDRHPEILPVDPETGRVRGFGSRRHYDFSSPVYRRESDRITLALAERYGHNPYVAGWQTDNEISCHDTTLSASPAAKAGFQAWCAARYGDIDALNTAWGNVFWSMEYRSFDEIELPVDAVTETNPAHRMAYRRYSSDQVVAFHDAQVKILRAHSPGKFVTHNFIPMNETGVDNHALAADLDFAAYDNYPLGRTDLLMAGDGAEVFRPYMRTGHPDFGTFFFDQTRGLAPGAFWIMEQQPGPVNWANHNPRPAPGMVRLWTLEAFAHGAGVVSYFRWRQAPFAQEQMHAGLLRPDSSQAAAWPEIEAVVRDLAALDLDQYPTARAKVALMVDVQAQWLGEIERQGRSYDYTHILLDHYRALRALSLDVDFVPPEGDVSGYALVVIPALATPSARTIANLKASSALVVFGPRSGAKTDDVTLPEGLPPGALRELLPIRVLSVETLRPDCPDAMIWNGKTYPSATWREEIELAGEAEVAARYADGGAAIVRAGKAIYVASLSDRAFLTDFLESLCAEAGVATQRLDAKVRVRRRGDLTFAFNYNEEPVPAPAPAGAVFVLGGALIGPRDAAVWKAPA